MKTTASNSKEKNSRNIIITMRALSIIYIFVILPILASFGTLAQANTTTLGQSIGFEYYRGIQSDIKRNILTVINDNNTWQEVLSSMPSINDELPVYDEISNTAIIFTSKLDYCNFIYEIDNVSIITRKDFEPDVNSILINIWKVDWEKKSDDNCENIDYSNFFNYHIIIINKTILPVSTNYFNFF